MSAHFSHKKPYCLVHYDYYHLIANSKVECFNTEIPLRYFFLLLEL